MELASQIYKRKSCRKYLDDEIDLTAIEEFLSNANPLISEIDYSYDILTRNEVSSKMIWSSPYYLAIYSEKKENYGVNVGFVFEQVSLFMQSLDIGSCWVGMGSAKKEKEDFVILMAFGKSDNFERDITQFKRKKLSEIADVTDERLEPARLAPSAINMQPWYFKHTKEGFDVFKVKHSFLKRKIVARWNDIDIGIALAHMYVSNPDTFNFEFKNKEDIKGYTYIGSLKI
jgi:nitroreductase